MQWLQQKITYIFIRISEEMPQGGYLAQNINYVSTIMWIATWKFSKLPAWLADGTGSTSLKISSARDQIPD